MQQVEILHGDFSVDDGTKGREKLKEEMNAFFRMLNGKKIKEVQVFYDSTLTQADVYIHYVD